MVKPAGSVALILGVVCWACGPAPPPAGEPSSAEPAAALDARGPAGARQLDPPASDRAFAPSLAMAGGELLLTWLEALGSDEAPRHRLLFSRLADDGWRPPVVVAEGDDFFANWADFPHAVRMGDGSLLVHRLVQTAADTYAYSIELARSTDGGATWAELGRLNDDATHTEHGFVAFVPEGEGVRAFWLDGREMVAKGPMTLRTAFVTGDGVGDPEILDPRVCECCSTDAALTAAGPVVVFRDRSDAEIRDVSIVRRDGASWTPPAPVAADDWRIPGCPVNGPEIAAEGERAVVAWFTGADDAPRVRAAFSADGGSSFGGPLEVDADEPHGRVDVVLDGEGGAVVSWLARGEGVAEVRLRRLAADGRQGAALGVASTAAARRSGFPRLARLGDRLYLAWVETGEGPESRVRLRELPLAAVPPPA